MQDGELKPLQLQHVVMVDLQLITTQRLMMERFGRQESLQPMVLDIKLVEQELIVLVD